MIYHIKHMKNYKFTILLVLLSISILSTPVSSVDTDETVSPILIIGGQEGSGKGQFNEPDSIFVSSDGLYYAGDTEKISEFKYSMQKANG